MTFQFVHMPLPHVNTYRKKFGTLKTWKCVSIENPHFALFLDFLYDLQVNIFYDNSYLNNFIQKYMRIYNLTCILYYLQFYRLIVTKETISSYLK